jgi:hypothetical protein
MSVSMSVTCNIDRAAHSLQMRSGGSPSGSEHHDAGVDHVCLQVLPADPSTVRVPDWSDLSGLLLR